MKAARPRSLPLGTVRFRLTLLATTAVAAVLVLSGVGLVVAQGRLMTRNIDETLAQRADNIQTDVMRGAFGARLPTEGDREDSFLQLVDADREVVAASANVVAMPAATDPLEPRAGQTIVTVSDVPLSRHEFRILARSTQSGSTQATLLVGKNLDDVKEGVAILTTSLAVSIPLVVLLLAGLVWWLTGRVLRPVESIRAEVASIGGAELHRRVPVPDSSDEISRLARTMNAMLDRVQQATDRERRFVADASHEFRSPLTRLRSALEVGLAHPETTDPTSTYLSLLDDTGQLQQLVDDLLFLARSEAGSMSRPATAVDLDDLVFQEARRLRERGLVHVVTSAVSAARVQGDDKQLARAIRNLASNAERHAAHTVWFEVREHSGLSELVVADDGSGIPVAHHATVFNRFTRLDRARSQGEGSSGLGLAIVHDIVTRHGGTITITSSDGEGARLVVTLPRVD